MALVRGRDSNRMLMAEHSSSSIVISWLVDSEIILKHSINFKLTQYKQFTVHLYSHVKTVNNYMYNLFDIKFTVQFMYM